MFKQWDCWSTLVCTYLDDYDCYGGWFNILWQQKAKKNKKQTLAFKFNQSKANVLLKYKLQIP